MRCFSIVLLTCACGAATAPAAAPPSPPAATPATAAPTAPAPATDTLYIIASNTKALTTLLLAKLVDEHRLTWDTPVTRVMPSFKLGDEATTRSVLVKHLICACTRLPRQDLEWLFDAHRLTPAHALTLLGTVQPTSAFGALFQYSVTWYASCGDAAGDWHRLAPAWRRWRPRSAARRCSRRLA